MNGSRMKDIEWIMNDKQAISKFQGVIPVERSYMVKEDRNEEKGEFSAACGIEKIVREENDRDWEEWERRWCGRAFQSVGAWK